jgi:hypothetical protein
MKVGDLVKFKSNVIGLESLRGIVVSADTFSAEVYWYKEAYHGSVTHKNRVISELQEFLEVIDESR